jgi:hypothetical protein
MIKKELGGSIMKDLKDASNCNFFKISALQMNSVIACTVSS